MILLIDNYDSFTYNLVQRLGELDAGLDLQVYRNDQITIDRIAELKPSHIIVSPGPCTPKACHETWNPSSDSSRHRRDTLGPTRAGSAILARALAREHFCAGFRITRCASRTRSGMTG